MYIPTFISKKGTKPIYDILCSEHIKPFGQLKWNTKFAITYRRSMGKIYMSYFLNVPKVPNSCDYNIE